MYLLHNTIIGGNIPYDIINMNSLMDLYLSFTFLYGNIPSELVILKDLLYLEMDETRIYVLIPAKLVTCIRSNTYP